MTKKTKIAAGVVAAVACALLAWQITKRQGAGDKTKEGEGVGKSSASNNLATASRDVEKPRGALAGTVRDKEGPIAAVIQLTRLGDEPGAKDAVRANADGSFSFEGIEAGSYRVAASHKGYLPALSKSLEVEPGGKASVALTLTVGGNEVTGTISDISGGPVSNAFVRLTPIAGVLDARADRAFSTVTNAEGRFETSATDGAYILSAHHPDYVSSRKRVEISGGSRDLALALVPGAVVEGTVFVAGTREPAAGATVRYQRETVSRTFFSAGMRQVRDAGTVRAGADGKFRITGAGAGLLTLSARTYSAATTEETVVPIGIAETVTGVEMFVDAGYRISGKVVDEKGEPVEGANVLARADPLFRGAESDKDGRFSVGPLPSGSYMALANLGRRVMFEDGVKVEVEGKDVEGLTLEVKRDVLMIRGRVEPAVDAEVSVAWDKPGAGMLMGSQATDESGAFEIGPVVANSKVPLRAVSADGRLGEIDVSVGKDGADNVVIKLKEAASVSGRVVDQDGKPIPSATVALRPKRRGGSRTVLVNGAELSARRGVTRPDGSFLVRALEGGDYMVTVKNDRGQSLLWAKPTDKKLPSAPIALALAENEQKTGLSLAVEAPNAEIRGVILGADGRPAKDVFVSATPTFEFRSRPPGPPPEPPSNDAASGDAPETEEQTEMVMVVASSGDDDEGGGGFASAVSTESPPVITDEDGRFVIGGLRRGDYDITAEGMRGTARAFANKVETGSDIKLKLLPLTVLRGTVTRDDKPVENFTIELKGPTQFTRRFSDAGGAFTIRRLDPGPYTLVARGDGGETKMKIDVAADKESVVEVLLEGQITVRGAIVDKAGEPVSDAMIVLSPARGEGDDDVSISISSDEPPAKTDAAGAFETRSLPGKYMLIAIKPGTGAPLLMKPIEVTGDLDLGTLTADGVRPPGGAGGPPGPGDHGERRAPG